MIRVNICIFHFLSTQLFVSVLSELEKLAKFRCDLDVTVQKINDLRPLLQMTKSEVPIEELSARLDSPSSSSSPVGLSDSFDANEYLTDVAVTDLSSDGTETETEGEKKPKEEIALSEAKP